MKKFFLFSIVLGVLILAGFFVMAQSISSNVISAGSENIKTVTLKVSIPCEGHSFLIKNNLNSLKGVTNIEYTPITTFVVSYDSSKLTEKDILSLDVFREYPAKKIG